MKTRGVHLQYSFETDGQLGAQIDNPVFDLLSAVREHGSIRHAAAARGASYRHVWGAIKHWEQVLGEPLVSWVQGQPARLTPFADRLLWAETRARTRLTPHIEALRAELERVLSDALDGNQQVLTIWASHDLALPQLREVASGRHRLHMDLRFAGSVDALQALAQGRCLVAGFHVPPISSAAPHFAAALKPLLKPGRHKLIGCLRRTQGLMLRRPNAQQVHTLRHLADSGVRFLNRQPGSGTRLLMDHLLHAEGLDPAAINGWDGHPEESHVAVAAAIASGVADCGPGIEAAAHQFGLDFQPLTEEDYFLVCLKEVLDHPAVLQLRAALQAPAWARALHALPGYEPSPDAGEVLSLTRALPWWNYRAPKPAGVAQRKAPAG
ncbi:periplasmic molybdate-binding protein/domain protein [Burkholderiales bacterium JOSHI_001]|nr:periplasmic molybdate-binding protein/domain protein [Burkholderiales bacterium JOSHI_001]